MDVHYLFDIDGWIERLRQVDALNEPAPE